MESVFQSIKSSAEVRPNTIQFQLTPTHVAYANTLRRLCMCHVEMVGFRADIKEDGSTTDVQVLANSTPMTNEMLAHRIGLLPIHVKDPLKWDSESTIFELSKENTTDSFMDITASEFIVKTKTLEGESAPRSASEYFRPHPVTQSTSLLAVLKPLMPGGKPEEIRIRAKATVGTGRDNARFIPTSQCAYEYTRNTNPEAIQAAFIDWAMRTKKVSEATLQQDAAKKDVLFREFKTLDINRCYLKDETGEPYSFDFTIESTGVLDPFYIVRRACEAGVTLCERYTGDSLPDDVTVQVANCELRAIDFFFQKQDHTLGHLIQAWIDANLIGKGAITFAGYDIPHPLRDEMVIRIGVAGENPEATARNALREAMNACRGMFATWRDQWDAATGMTKVIRTQAPTEQIVQPAIRRITRPSQAKK